jgi:hypothetical protein
MGSFVNMLATRQEAGAFTSKLEGEHEVVGLWTREIAEEDEHIRDTVAFDGQGGFEPSGEAPPEA